ncbi:UNKNOWN [Stylonychia lemnae]|uniref:Uncharacterized protein n=1 Tax=Stylonychia lemnae TaxID=5949 RepID=A0A078B1P0_STYLE|nr:UNKNOWN [Stylonychia lemnae]|eukprot:CDW88216.1 UNKNOWN [Stylonychia lemnae]
MKAFNPQRFFAIRSKFKSLDKKCQSIPIVHKFIQDEFLSNFYKLQDQIKYSGTPFALKLLRVTDRVAGKKSKISKDATTSIQLDIKNLIERVNLKIIEEIDDIGKVSNDTLMQIVYIYDEFGNTSDLTTRAIKETYQEIINRGHTLTYHQIEEMENVFNRMTAFKGIDFNPRDYSLIIESMSREQMDSVLLCLPPRTKDLLETSNDADHEIVQYLKYQHQYKLQEAERILYQKVNKLRRANASLSILYHKTSDSTVEVNSKYGLIMPSLEWSIKQTYSQLNAKQRKVDDFFNNLKSQIFLDQVEYTTNLAQQHACPTCNPEKINYGPEMHYPFIRGLTNKEVNKSFLEQKMAQNILEHVKQFKKPQESYRVLAFLDNEYCNMFNIAKYLLTEHHQIKQSKEAVEGQINLDQTTNSNDFSKQQEADGNSKNEEKEISIEDYIKLSFLFEGHTHDKIIQDNQELAKKIWEKLTNKKIFDKVPDHKYDYKCFPINLFQSNQFQF